MSNFTPIATNAPANAVTFNDPMAQIDSAIGDRGLLPTPGDDLVTAITAIASGGLGAGIIPDNGVTNTKLAADVKAGSLAALLTTVKTSLQAAINEVYTRLAGISTSDGMLKDGAVSSAAMLGPNVVATAAIQTGAVTTGKIPDQAIVTQKLADAGVTTAKLADANVSGAKLSPAAVDPVNVVWAPDNGRIQPDRSFNGKRRFWPLTAAAASLILETTPNVFGTYTLRLVTSSPSATGGKLLYPAEMRVTTGDQVIVRGRMSAASGSTYVFGARCHNASDGVVGGSTVTTPITPDDAAHDYTLPPLTITSDTAYVLLFVQRVTGSGAVSLYDLWGSKGEYAAQTPPRLTTTVQDGLSGRPGVVYDPLFKAVMPSMDVGGVMSWVVPQDLTPIWNDANNPYGGATIRMADTASKTGGKRFKVGDGGTVVGDVVAFAAVVMSASGTVRLNCAFYDATNTIIGTPTTGPTIATSGTAQYVWTPPAVIPTTTVFIAVYVQRTSGSGPTDIYAMWGGKDGICDAAPMLCPVPQLDRELLPLLATFGKERMQDWKAKCAKMQLNLSPTQTRIVCLGDSWIGHSLITTPLRSALQTTWGDAGFGYVDFYATYTQSTAYREGVTTGAATARTGTWTDTTHTPISPTAKGPGLTDIRTSDSAATLSLETSVACTAIDIWSYQQAGGGTYEVRVDGGAWTAVDTDNAAAGLNVKAITGLSNAVHVVEIRVTVAGSQGVVLLGLNLKKATAGVTVHTLGTNGTTSVEWAAIPATLWQNELAQLAPTVVIVQLGTNDRANTLPSAFGANVQIVINRIRAAMPQCDILLETPADVLAVNTGYTLTAFISAMRDIATRNKATGFVSSHEAIGLRDDADARGLYADAAHLNSIGFRILSNQLVDYLRVV